ncbi:hypothetical protein M758_10G034700 [Ceratodon purpureus]|nr:hypothetical protein M758_10G034700 [Ceratodon purpureus]
MAFAYYGDTAIRRPMKGGLMGRCTLLSRLATLTRSIPGESAFHLWPHGRGRAYLFEESAFPLDNNFVLWL